jgi:hypothetical protein
VQFGEFTGLARAQLSRDTLEYRSHLRTDKREGVGTRQLGEKAVLLRLVFEQLHFTGAEKWHSKS